MLLGLVAIQNARSEDSNAEQRKVQSSDASQKGLNAEERDLIKRARSDFDQTSENEPSAKASPLPKSKTPAAQK